MAKRNLPPADRSSLPGGDHQLAVRITPELLHAIDEEVERLRAERPGSKVQRSDAVREILYQVLLAEPATAADIARRRSASRRTG
jgi:hypothetical protein